MCAVGNCLHFCPCMFKFMRMENGRFVYEADSKLEIGRAEGSFTSKSVDKPNDNVME